MIGQRLESQPGFPFGAVFCFVLSAIAVAVAVILPNTHIAVFAILPATTGFALFLARDRQFTAQLTQDGLEIENEQILLPYKSIDAVLMPGRMHKATGTIQIYHADGILNIPPRLNVPSNELFAFLINQLPLNGSRDLPAPLARYCSNQESRFGADRVYSFRARQHRPTGQRKKVVAFLWGCAAAGPLWCGAGIALRDQGVAWIVFGIVLTATAALLASAFRFESSGPRVKNWRQAALVISPGGLALMQGEMQGELRWPELRNVRYQKRRGAFEITVTDINLRGIDLVVQGATLTIANLYDRPLAVIHQRIMDYWQGEDEHF